MCSIDEELGDGYKGWLDVGEEGLEAFANYDDDATSVESLGKVRHLSPTMRCLAQLKSKPRLLCPSALPCARKGHKASCDDVEAGNYRVGLSDSGEKITKVYVTSFVSDAAQESSGQGQCHCYEVAVPPEIPSQTASLA